MTYLCFIAKNFEGQSVGTNIIGAALTNGIERSQANGGNAAQWQIASVAPANRTRSAARTRIDATTDPIEVTQPSGETQQYISLKIQPTSGTPAGKFLRSFGVDTRDWWLASGCSDTDVRGAADLMNLGDNTQFSSPNAMTYGAFNQVEFSWNKSDGNGHTWLNGASQWSVNWTDTDWSPGGTLDIGAERDDVSLCAGSAQNPWYFTDYFVDYTRARFVIGDNSTFTSCTRHEFQVPVSWSTGSVQLGMNLGEFAALTGKHLFFLDSAETVTYLGHWQ